MRQGALHEPLGVAFGAIRRSGLSGGEAVVVIGAGPIGLLIVAAARYAGAGTILVSEPNPHRRAMAADLGADVLIDPAHTPLEQAVLAATKGKGTPQVFETAGVPHTIQTAVNVASVGGTVTIASICLEPATIVPSLWYAKEIDLRYSTVSDKPTALRVLTEQQIDVERIVTSEADLDEITEAFTRLGEDSAEVKILVRPTG